MANLSNKIRKYLDREVDFQKDVLLQDDGDGVVYIKEWNVGEARPTDAQLDSLDAQADSLESSKAVIAKRKASYPPLKEFAEAYTEKEFGGDSTKMDAYKIKYNKVRSDNPK